jgi:DNA-binding transcriptional LysR family regulator
VTTEQLRYFVSIAENGSFSLTAEEQHISQSAVSKQIRAFEWELGCVLFHRGPREVKLSALGEKLYPTLKGMLDQYELLTREARNAVEKGPGGPRGRVKIAALPILGQYAITGALRAFEEGRPDRELQITEAEEPEVLASLENNECDLAILRGELLGKGDLRLRGGHPGPRRSYTLAMDRLALFVHEHHPWAAYKTIGPEKLKDETFMLMPEHTSVYRQAVDLLGRYGFSPRILASARIETILSSVASGRCVSLLMRKTIDVFRSAHIKVIPLKPACTSRVIALCSETGAKKEYVQELAAFLALHPAPRRNR